MSNEEGQMDGMTRRLVDFAEAARYEALPADTVRECKRRVIDTFASALGAYHEAPARLARNVASRTRGDAQATLWERDRHHPRTRVRDGVMVSFSISRHIYRHERGHPAT